MSKSSPDSWKLEIDPDLNIPIKLFLKILRQLKDSTDDGVICIKEEFLPLLDSPDIQPTYDGEELKNLRSEIMGDLSKQIDILFKQPVSERKLEIENSLEELLSLTEGFSEASKEYYRKKIVLLSKGSLFKPTIGLDEEKKRKNIKSNSKELGSIFLSLMIRNIFLDEESFFSKDGDEELYNDPASLSFILGTIHSLFSQIAFQSTIEELLKKGDDNSLLKAVRIDNGIIRTETFQRRIRKSKFTSDNFNKKLAKEILKKPLKKEAPNYETYIVLKYFWMAGLCKLNPEDLHFFLKDCEVRPDPPKPEYLDKFLTRYIRLLYRN